MPSSLDFNRDDTVFLIDGSGYIFRAYYAVRPLNSKKGVPTNAVYGFTSMLLKLLKEHNPKHIAIAFDTKGKNFRHDLYADYKANRPPPPEDLIPQFDLIHQVVDAFRIKRLVKSGYEADDLIGTMAAKVRAAGHPVVIVTGDKDFMQLVDDQVWLLDELRASKNGTEIFVDRDQVIQKFGVPPEQVVDVLALAGDTSDNVPGVRGIGEKTAVELISKYGSVENILKEAPNLAQKSRREKLIEGHDMALLCKKLVTICCDADLPVEMEDLKSEPPSKAELAELFEELNFKRLLQDPWIVNGTSQKPETEPSKSSSDEAIDRSKYLSVTTIEDLHKVIHELSKVKTFSIDTETDSLDAMNANLIGISLSWSKGKAAYIPVGHDFVSAPTQLSLIQVREVLSPVLADSSKKIIAQNAKYDRHVLSRAGFPDFCVGGDPMLASYILDADTQKHNLDDLSQRYLDHTNITYEEVCGKGKEQIPFSAVPIEKAVEYSGEDADVTFRLEEILEKNLKTAKLDKLYTDLELPLEEVLCDMEQTGVCIDTRLLKVMSVEFEHKLVALEKEAFEVAGSTFNLASPKQVSEILFQKLGLTSAKKTKTGESTDASVLEQLAHEHPLPKILLEHRLISKLKGTYVDALPKLVNPRTGRVHTSFNQAITATGRLSSSDPNLQNIPIRSPEGRRIREAFVAKEGFVLISLDYSQIELRILAHVSGDPVMTESFMQGQDVHQRTASEVFGVPLEQVTKEQRSFAKTINFGLLYGMGVHRLSQTLGIPRKEASTYLDRYYERYAGIYEWQKTNLAKAKEEAEVRTLLGRRRPIPDIRSENHVLAKRAERIAINAPIQGTAADIIKIAMIQIDRRLKKEYPTAKMILQVHDELLLEVPKDDSEIIAKIVEDIMCDAYKLNVPLVLEKGMGASWALAH